MRGDFVQNERFGSYPNRARAKLLAPVIDGHSAANLSPHSGCFPQLRFIATGRCESSATANYHLGPSFSRADTALLPAGPPSFEHLDDERTYRRLGTPLGVVLFGKENLDRLYGRVIDVLGHLIDNLAARIEDCLALS